MINSILAANKSTWFLLSIFVFLSFFCYASGANYGFEAKANDSPEFFLSQYIQIHSVTGNERPAGEFLAQACREAGLHVRVFTDATDSYNFAASLYPLDSEKPNVVFLNHIDVVSAGDYSRWTYPPFVGVIADGHVWGRGAIDNKGHGVMQFFAIKDFVERASELDFSHNFTLLAVSNEEKMGSLGAGIIASEYLDELNPVLVLGEGGAGMTGIVQAQPHKVVFGIETVQKMALWFKLESRGSSAGHGSVPSDKYPTKELVLACNTILNLKPEIFVTPVVREMFGVLGSLESGILGLALKNINLVSPLLSSYLRKDEMAASLLTNTIVLTGLSSEETAHNQVAQSAVAIFDSRLLPGTDAELFLDEIRDKIRKYDVDLVVLNWPEPSPASPKNHYYYAIEKAIWEVFPDAVVSPILFPAVNDNRFFRQKGIPTFGITPAVLTQELLMTIHNADERLPVKALHQGIDVFKAFINLLISE